MLRATSQVIVPEAARLIGRLCDHFADHGNVETGQGFGRISVLYGTATLEAREDVLHLEAQAEDALYLSYMKMGLAEHIFEMAEGPRPHLRWAGDGAGETIPLFFREMRVVSSMRLTPHVQRIRLQGEDLARFSNGGLHVRLLFPPKGRAPVWPRLGEDGCIAWPQGANALVSRVYTIRHLDADHGLMDIDIVLHPGVATPGSSFAETAQPGHIVGLTGPGGGCAPERSSLILAGDETALPAIARILEAMPAHARAEVLIEVDGASEEQDLPCRATTRIRYLHRNGRPAGTAGLLPDAVRSADWSWLGADAFVWAGCEFSDFRAIRRYLRQERKMKRKDHLVVAYWRRGKTGDEARADAAKD